ncbi:MAG: hypothetical protein ACPGXZ_05835 [Saprospiraceae bacterium]
MKNNTNKKKQDKLDEQLQETFGNQDLNDFRRTLEETSSQRRKSSFFIPIIVIIILLMLYFIFFY